MSIRSIRLPVLFFVALGALSASPFGAAKSEKSRDHDQFIVHFDDAAPERRNAEARQRVLDAGGRPAGVTVKQLRRLGIGADVVRTSRKLDYRAARGFMARLRRNPGVAYVEIDQVVKPLFPPNDTFYASHQWHYWDAIGGINLPAAWDQSTGSGVVVAVLDTGITAHPDLNANIVAGYDFIAKIENARDGDGYDSNPADEGDWAAAGDCGEDEEAEDSSWHGTHVAGTVAAVTNNGAGVAGVARDAKVMPLRVLGRCGGNSSDIANAITWAAGGNVPGVPVNPNPVEVINMSLGGEGTCGFATQFAIDKAIAAGVTVVVAAGNDDVDVDGYQPASCAGVITVAATNRAGGRAGYSNYGNKVDVAAPGGENPNYVASTYNSGDTTPLLANYVGMSGTSMAAPHVAGTVALMQSAHASSPAGVEGILKSTARTLPVACPEGCGSGIIDAARAVGEASGGALLVSDVSKSEGNSGTTLYEFTVSLSRPMPTPVTFTIASANGSAMAGSDYTAISLAGQSIAAGATSKTYAVLVHGDTMSEPRETFFVNVSGVSGIAVADAQGVGTIVNDDPQPLGNGVPVTGLAAAGGETLLFSFEVPPGKTSVVFSTSGGTGDVDLYGNHGTMPTGDEANDDCQSYSSTNTEECVITPAPAGTYYLVAQAYSSIAGVTLVARYLPDIDPLDGLSVNDVSLSEGNAGSKQATFNVSLGRAQSGPVTFDVSTGNGTALPGSDFVSKSTAGVSIPAGQTSAQFAVTINGDVAVEDNETFTVNLANVVGANVTDGQGLGRILNDDLASLSIADVQVAEGNAGNTTASFLITLSRPMPSPVTFNIATSNGSASAGSDYTASSQTARYLDAGRSSLRFEVPVHGDGNAEANETFNVTISNVVGANLGDGSATATIINDDGATAAAAATVSTNFVMAPTLLETRKAARLTIAQCRAENARRSKVGKGPLRCEATVRRKH